MDKNNIDKSDLEIEKEEIFFVEDEYINIRLDNYLLEKLQGFTRSQIKHLIESGLVLINGKIKKAGEKLKAKQEIKVSIPKTKEVSIEKEDIDIDIVYQDEDLAVINKKQGMVVHPAVGNLSGTLVNALLFNIKDLSGINGEIRPGIVHRLDKDTSGLLVVAKNDKAHLNLSKQIQTKECKRHYKAIVIGNLKDDSGTVQTYIGRSSKDRKKMAVVDETKGKLAITNYQVIERFKGYTFVEYELKTGRTHQIRVHSAYLKAPILGDFVYAPNQKNNFKLNGQLLHAYKLEFTQPTTNKQLSFEVALPNYFENVLEILKNNYKI
ncbi:MAG: RluA family pseudouridine synthase [Clostridia bacterium]|nr:RluA family pseudouridine synthase [Clostridia bacterium]